MADEAQRQPNGRFKRGHSRIVGRVKGEPNKISRDLREGILDACIAHGSDGNGLGGLQGCVSWLLKEHTKAFMPLLVRLLPLQVSAQVTKHSKLTVNILPVPRGHFYDAEGVLHRGTPPLCIDHDDVGRAEEPATMDHAPPPPMPQRAATDDGSAPSAA